MNEAMDKLYETFYMKVYSFVMTLARNKETAQEITQETFFRAMTSKQPFRGESQQLSWLCAIAKNLYTDELRHSSHFVGEIPEDKPDSAESLEKIIADKEQSFRIHKALHELDEPYKEVFQLRVFGELSFKEIGAIFKKTESWSRVTYHRARMKLKERLDENEG